jgi:hypothetical protein
MSKRILMVADGPAVRHVIRGVTAHPAQQVSGAAVLAAVKTSARTIRA